LRERCKADIAQRVKPFLNRKPVALADIDPLFEDSDTLRQTIQSSLFRRGLPLNTDLRIPAIGAVLAQAVAQERLYDWSHHVNLEGLRTCYVKGWLQAECDDKGETCYVFPTDLHRW
jgi:hypothetical protein